MSVPATSDTLIAELARAGFARIDPPVLQPAAVFLDVSGEDLRRRMFLTQGADGREMCLRPDLTVPAARAHLERGGEGEAAYCYLGPVFRHRSAGPSEFLQGGVEIFGRADRASADAEVLACARSVCELYGVADAETRVGDLGIVNAFVDALDLPAAWKRRLVREASREGRLDVELDALLAAREGSERSGFLAALDGANPAAARAVVEDLLAIAGISTVGGRSVSDIAERFLEQARLQAGARLPEETRTVLSRLLEVEGDLASAALALRALAGDAQLPVGRALDAFEQRNAALAARGGAPESLAFAARFGRPLGYYTGLVFEIRSAARHDLGPLVGGGRYDGLMQTLGAPAPVPAVGCAFWIERLQEAGR